MSFTAFHNIATRTITRLARHWQTRPEGSMVADPSLSLDRRPLLAGQQRAQRVEEWTGIEHGYPLDRSLPQLFEAQVERTPDAVAVVWEGQQRTYRELNQQANQLAHLLSKQGVGPETLVALLSERGIPLLVEILAVFKAGGAYLPLDPHHPEDRLRRVIEQSQCTHVISSAACAGTQVGAVAAIAEELRPRCLTFEGLPLDRFPDTNLPLSSTPYSLVYVIYTSGSTGRPKGAMVEQRGMINHLYAKIEALDLTAADTVAQTASQCFDISVWQYLAVLLVGGRVQIYPDDVAHDSLVLLQQVEQHRVTILETVPSMLRAMLDTTEKKRASGPALRALRWMIPTGEALPVELCRRWLTRYPRIPLLNAYGPTECSDDVTHYVIAEPPSEDTRSIPIGKAIPNLRLYVLDEHLQVQPTGVSGELYVGGVGVGRGYLGDAGRTAEAFVDDPFSRVGARLYKTGDLGRYLPDGNLEFLGRVDFQVKLRGFRIELGEIEAVLNQYPGVHEAVAIVREDVPGDQRLVAYVVLEEDQPPSIEELKRHLMQQLPIYMVPAAFVPLARLPLTSNGKLDRRALPVPAWGNRETAESYVAPVLPIHKQLVAIWEEFLGVQPIGIKDDFFALGGDSLQAVQLFNRIEEVCGKKLALSTLFAGATIEQVAEALLEAPQVEQEAEKTRTPLVVVQTGGSRRPFFFLHGEWRGGALYTLELARTLGPEQPFYLLEPYKFDGLAVPPTFEEMAAAHLETLRRVQPEGPYTLGGYCNGALMAYEMARQLHAQGQAVDLLLLIDADAPARHRWVRRSIARFCNLIGINQKKQFEWFLCLQHIYRYTRFAHYRQSKKALLPNVETLRQDYLNMYDWSASDYAPDPYTGKITFFWTSEEPWRPVGWRNVVKAKDGDVDIHMLPGNHITSRTEYLPVLAECLRACLKKAQTPVMN